MHRASSMPDVGGGFYTVSEAARLLGFESNQRITRWMKPGASGTPPVILRDYPKIGLEHEISFLDLVEVRFVEHFRQVKISLQSLRVAAKNARDELGVSHPFATSNVKFQTDRRQIFLQAAKETGDPFLLNLMTKQVAIYEVIERAFASDLTFDLNGLARMWKPSPASAPNVIVAPVYAFGRPVISDRFVPTKTLFEFWQANENDIETTAEWFSIDAASVDEAIRFELRPLH